MLGYQKTSEHLVVRSKHRVSFRVGLTVEELITLLQDVPARSTVDQVLECVQEGNDISCIEFHCERIAPYEFSGATK